MNFQKYTKAELISKFKQLQKDKSNNDLFAKLLVIKTFLLKISLMALLIKLFRKYSIIRKIWTVLNWLAVSVFGLTFIDIYGSEFIVNIISFLKSTQIYQWYSHLLGYKSEEVKQKPSSGLKSSNLPSTSNKERSAEDYRLLEWFDKIKNKQPEIIDNEQEDNLKYYIIYGVIITISCCFIYHYWDDITPYASNIWNWFKGRRGGDNPGNNSSTGASVSIPSQTTGNISIPTNSEVESSRLAWDKFKQKFKLWKDNSSNPISESLTEEIEVIDNTNPTEGSSGSSGSNESIDRYFPENPTIKGKEVDRTQVLTSPSLEKLNTSVEETWSSSTRDSSPDSSSSGSTIKPYNPISSEGSTSSSSTVNPASLGETIQPTNPTKIDESLSSISSNIKPFLKLHFLDENIQINKYNFKTFIDEDTLSKINLIENSLKGTINIQPEKVVKNLIDIVKIYDSTVKSYLNNKDSLKIDKWIKLKNYHFLWENEFQ